jgi:acetyl-CoA synthetase
MTGETPWAFVTSMPERTLTQADVRRLEQNCSRDVGEYAVPARFVVVNDIPETLTGKYMRRLVQKIVQGGELGDTSALKNPASISAIKDALQRQSLLCEPQADL